MADESPSAPTVDRAGLEKLREKFPPESITKVPRGEDKDQPKYRCDVCGGWHHPVALHLDAAGHAVVTDRLLSVDPEWRWEPMATENGRPALEYDKDGQPVGLWIYLTVCGVTRIGYGSTGTRNDAVKELIGDALRNAAMRFGVALDLWGKVELESQRSGDTAAEPASAQRPEAADTDGVKVASKRDRDRITGTLNSIADRDARTAAKREYLERFGITRPDRLPADQVPAALEWADQRVGQVTVGQLAEPPMLALEVALPAEAPGRDALIAGIKAYEDQLPQDAWPTYTAWLTDKHLDDETENMPDEDLETVWRYLHVLAALGKPA